VLEIQAILGTIRCLTRPSIRAITILIETLNLGLVQGSTEGYPLYYKYSGLITTIRLNLIIDTAAS
jgi:hypothetical protein